ncbi:fimbrial usher protein StbD [Rahnella inusitata]
MNRFSLIVVLLTLTLSVNVHATCIKVTSTSSLTSELISSGYTAKSWEGASYPHAGDLGLPGVVQLSTTDSFMPGGTLLASSSPSFLTAASDVAYTANQILFRCELSDAGSLSEIYTTNAVYDYSGRYETSDIEGAYHTLIRNLAIRFTNLKTGKFFLNTWQSRELTSDDWVEDENYIYIPASAFSDITVELFKTNSTVYTSPYAYASQLYPDSIDPALISFRGPGLATASIVDGASISSGYPGWPPYWPGGFSIFNKVRITRGAMCLVKDYPSVVLLPTISTASLNDGKSSQNTFNISLSCEDAAVSSVTKSTTSTANVAMGFLVNQSTAVTAATTLGLTSTSGLTHLLDTHYGSSGVASGVGIRLYDESGSALNLLSSRTTATGNSGGWYAYKALTTSQGDSTDGVTTYTGNFTASLEAISGETVSAGTVNAQLQVVVSFQ